MDLRKLEFSLAELQHGYRSARFTPLDVAREALRRSRDYGDPHVWIAPPDEGAILARAAALMQPGADTSLPLYGLPFSVKDNVDVAGLPTTCGCAGFDRLPGVSATGVAKAIAAGAMLIGKNSLDQFATGLNGTRTMGPHCLNAFDPRIVPGGSSSGSGVAVAAGLVTFSLGSDTGGSGRVPAAMNNVVGVKPTLGLVSSAGMVYNNRFFDCMPVFARTVEEGYAVLEVIRGYDADDAFSRRDADSISLSTLVAALGPHFRFAVPRAADLAFFGDRHAEQAFAAALDAMQAIGGNKTEIDFALFIEAGRLPFDSGLLAERAISYGHVVAEHPDTVHPAVAAMIKKGQAYSGVQTMQAVYRMTEMRREALRLFAGFDVLVTPTVGRAYTCDELKADPIGLNTRIGYYTYPVNPLDLCALALPASIRPDGVPFGISLVAPAAHDGVLRAIGRRFEAAARLRPGVLACRKAAHHHAQAPHSHTETSKETRKGTGDAPA